MNKADKMDEIQPELLKYEELSMVNALMNLFNERWKTQTVFED